jgi:hypothetical protein
MSDLESKYQIIHDPSPSAKKHKRWCVKLTASAGKWEGIVYSYGKIQIKEPSLLKPNPTMSFEQDIWYVPDRFRGVDFSEEDEKDFKKLVGDILISIIEKYSDRLTKSPSGKMILDLENPFLNKSDASE